MDSSSDGANNGERNSEDADQDANPSSDVDVNDMQSNILTRSLAIPF